MLDYKTITFLTLCEQMNYRKTAEILNMTQPGVTQHIHALEREFNCKLFSYNGKSLSLTEQGKLYREYLQKVKYDEKWLREKMQERKIPNLHIGATKSIGDYMISEPLAALLNSGEFTLDLIVDNTQVLLEQIKKGILDFAMIEGDFDKNAFGYQKMWAEPFVGICALNHPFANKSIDLENIFAEHLLLREEGSGTRAIFEQQLAYRGESIASFKKVNYISSFHVMKEIIAAGSTISFGYHSVIANDDRLASFTVSGFAPTHDLYYVFQKDSHASALLNRYLELAKV